MPRKIYILSLSCLLAVTLFGLKLSAAQETSSLKDYFTSEDSGLYISADSQNPLITHFELRANDKINFKGSFNKETKKLEAFADLKEVTVSDFFPKLKNLYIKQAKIILKNNNLTIENAQLRYKSFPFSLKGGVENIKSPSIQINITGELIDLNLKAEYIEDVLQIKELIITANSSQIASTGTVNPEGKTFQIKGTGFLYFLDIQKLFSALGEKFSILDNLDSNNPVEINFSAKGGDDFDSLQAEFHAFNKNLTIYDVEAKNISAYILKKNNFLTIDSLLAEIGNGTLNCKAKINTLNNSLEADISLKDIYIEEATKNLNLNKKAYAGKLSLKALVKNINLNSLEEMRGQGNISIGQGNIWQIDFLKGLGRFLSIPDFEEITFGDGYTDFTLSGDKIHFQNLKLTSQQMDITGAGTLSTKGELEFLLYPEFNQDLIDSSEGLQKYIGTFFKKSGLAIRITGTTKKPQYKVKPLIIEPLKEIKGIFEELL